MANGDWHSFLIRSPSWHVDVSRQLKTKTKTFLAAFSHWKNFLDGFLDQITDRCIDKQTLLWKCFCRLVGSTWKYRWSCICEIFWNQLWIEILYNSTLKIFFLLIWTIWGYRDQADQWPSLQFHISCINVINFGSKEALFLETIVVLIENNNRTR